MSMFPHDRRYLGSINGGCFVRDWFPPRSVVELAQHEESYWHQCLRSAIEAGHPQQRVPPIYYRDLITGAERVMHDAVPSCYEIADAAVLGARTRRNAADRRLSEGAERARASIDQIVRFHAPYDPPPESQKYIDALRSTWKL